MKLKYNPFYILLTLITITMHAQRQGSLVVFGDSMKVYNGFSFSPDGNKLYTSERILNKIENSRAVYKTWGDNKRPYTTLYHYDLQDHTWSNKQRISFANDSLDFFPTIDAEGRRLFFNSRRRLPKNDSLDGKIHIWISENSDKGWSDASYHETINIPGYHSAYVHALKDGSIVFQSNRPGSTLGSDGLPSLDFWISEWSENTFKEPQPLHAFNSTLHEEQITFSNAGRLAIFTRNNGNDMEVFLSVKERDLWRKPRPVYLTDWPGYVEQCPRISLDQKSLYYAHGTLVMQVLLEKIMTKEEMEISGLNPDK